MEQIKFKIFGFVVLVERDVDGWRVYYPGTDGKKRLADFIVPKDLKDDELDQYLGDLFMKTLGQITQTS